MFRMTLLILSAFGALVIAGCANPSPNLVAACEADKIAQPIVAPVVGALVPQAGPLVAADAIVHPALQALCAAALAPVAK